VPCVGAMFELLVQRNIPRQEDRGTSSMLYGTLTILSCVVFILAASRP
jgi:hypothetical protein